MVRKLAGTLATVGMLSSPLAFALGLGEAELLSSLNQPFKAKIQLAQTQDVSAQDIRVQLADERAFAKAGLDREFFLQNLNFSVRPGDSGPYIELTSSQPVKEPFLNFLLEVEWPQGQLMREYTFLLDPPTYNKNLTQEYAQSSADAQPLPAPAAGNLVEEGAKRIKIGPMDTLWSLARENRPDNRITIKQAMLAIQEANPDAFPTGNINNMEAGSTILIPTRMSMTDRSAVEASREVARQNKAWVASKAQAVPEPAPEPAKTAEPVEDSKPLKLVAEEETQQSSSGDKGLREELALSKESLDQSQREKEELSGRLDELQKQVNTLQKLIRLKDEQLAAMEAMLDKQNQLLSGKNASGESAAESGKASADEKGTDEAVEPPKASVASAATTGQVNAGAMGLDLAAQSEQNQQTENADRSEQSANAEPEKEPEPVKSFSLGKQETQELEPSSFLMDTLRKNAMLIGGGVAAVLALILLMMIMRRRRKSTDAEKKSDDGHSDLMAGAAGGAAGAAAFDSMSDDDLPDDLNLDDDVSNDLDDADLDSGDLDGQQQPKEDADSEWTLDDLGDADTSSGAVEDLGDMDLDTQDGDDSGAKESSETDDGLLDFDLGDIDTDPTTGDSEDSNQDLDDELNLDDLDFSEDFDLGDLDDSTSEDKEEDTDSPFVQAELTEDTLSAEDADSGESVQDNLIQPETVNTESLSEDLSPESDFMSDEPDAEAETETTQNEEETQSDDDGLIDLEGDDLSDLDFLADEPADTSDDLLSIEDLDTEDDDILAELTNEAVMENDSPQPLDEAVSSDDLPVEESPTEDSEALSADAPPLELTDLDDLSSLDTLTDDEPQVEPEASDDLSGPDDLSDLSDASETDDLSEADPKTEALEEAEAYRELGQPEQAAAILQGTLGESPEDNDVRLRFMDVLVELGDEATFDHELRQLQEMGDAKALGAALSMQQELYNKDATELTEDDQTFASDESDAATSDSQAAPDESDDSAYDLDLNRELDALERDFERYAEKEEPDVDFDLTDLESDVGHSDAAENEVQIDDLATDLSDLELPLSDTDDAYDFSDDQQALRSDTRDYLDDLGDLSMSASSDDALELGNLEDLVGRDLQDDDIVDLSPDIDQDGDLSDLGDLSDISFDSTPDDDGQLNVDDLLGENEDPEIKLDLARAYMDMGNTTSAIEALQDVLQRGDANQKTEAGELINKLQQ